MKLYDVYSLYPITPVRGKGCYIFDKQGNKYLDFYGGHAVISIGHSHPHYIERISTQLNQIGFYSNSVQNPLQQELADHLESISGLRGYDLFLINSGAEANENALKLASFYNDRKKALALENSFHGRTSGAINVTHTGIKHQAPINKGIDTQYCPADNLEEILAHLESKMYSCIIIEAIQGVGGLGTISPDSLEVIQTKCTETDTILIMDEVQCGYGRSGKFFAYQYASIQPDLITMAKGMGNGFPIGGVLINSKKIPAVRSRLGTTYGGNHLACSAGLAVLEVIQSESLVENAERLGRYLSKEMKDIRGIRTVKGKGLMLGVELDFAVAQFRKDLIFKYGVFTGSSANSNLLRLLPPLSIQKEDADRFLSKLSDSLNSI